MKTFEYMTAYVENVEGELHVTYQNGNKLDNPIVYLDYLRNVGKDGWEIIEEKDRIKWKYYLLGSLQRNNKGISRRTVEEINDIGRYGWELVFESVMRLDDLNISETCLIFKVKIIEYRLLFKRIVSILP